MADPRDELADIVVPLAPAAAQAPDAVPWVALAAALIVLAALAWFTLRRHRRRFARGLDRIGAAVARREGRPDALAGQLDRWARARYGLARLDPGCVPASVARDDWVAWVDDLAALRFGPASDAHWEALARLHARATLWPTRA